MLALAPLGTGCTEAADESPEGTITVGALLPFTGKEAAIGRNLEQALLLAVKDVNDAGGVNGHHLRLVTRDSNSGSERGFEQLLQLLYTDKVKYLIGPEETELANAVVPDIKALDVVDMLPGYAAPPIQQTGAHGGWVRLAPSTVALSCAMAKHVVRDGVTTVNALVTLDDFNASLASDFSSHFGSLGGTSLPSVTARAGSSSYVAQIDQVLQYGADRTLLMAPPASAATITTDWTIGGRQGAWYLSPLLHAEVFLENIPFGTLNGASGLSPSLSLASECVPGEGDFLNCSHGNARAFASHFSGYWQGDKPFPAANYYYDAVVLLALGLERGLANDGVLPTSRILRDYVRELGNPDAEPVRWNDLRGPLTEVRLGTDVRYVGAAAEYEFDAYGAAQHTVFDTWSIDNTGFADTGTVRAVCPKTF